ncbi:hypothetical protein KIH39_08780 [Telmatocola sphagniphila]|uniref:Uncharacterized protein n=1 Tax=Telmatocola sphagniphila TaxID=1123043 RepID=A0A8E6B9X8_9BACT|nr:hypothetical protein [Telmatocola sphagniphila]QVL33984.1 hypothetical protein KIH39_08780 [Telmatocola sphagniphila]
MKHFLFAFALMLGMTSIVRPADDNNPFRKVKEGDWVIFTMTMERGTIKSVGDSKTTVTAKTDKEVTISTVITLDGQKSLPREERIDLTKPYDPIWLLGLKDYSGVKLEKGEETQEKVKLGTKQFECTLLKSKTTSGIYTTHNKLWTSKDAPLGGMVKLEVLGERGAPANTWLELKGSGSK